MLSPPIDSTSAERLCETVCGGTVGSDADGDSGDVAEVGAGLAFSVWDMMRTGEDA